MAQHGPGQFLSQLYFYWPVSSTCRSDNINVLTCTGQTVVDTRVMSLCPISYSHVAPQGQVLAGCALNSNRLYLADLFMRGVSYMLHTHYVSRVDPSSQRVLHACVSAHRALRPWFVEKAHD